ncbi:hypothetical protein ACFQYP_22410 [Nonomuraea antimicrobica]
MTRQEHDCSKPGMTDSLNASSYEPPYPATTSVPGAAEGWGRRRRRGRA